MTTYSTDPALWIYTSLTAGSSHIVTATSRLETILRANRVPFKATDLATDQKARMLWGRRAGKDAVGRVRKLPALIQEGLVLGDLVEIEEWNEYGELKQHVKIYYDEFTIPNIHQKHPDPPKMRRAPVKKSAAAAAAKASTASTAATATASTASASQSASAPPPPTPPPAPEPKAAVSTTTKTSTAKTQPTKDEKSAALPIRSVADEAAQKAKELRLRTLREKVHGKKTEPSRTDAPKDDTDTTKSTAEKSAKTKTEKSGETAPAEDKGTAKETPAAEPTVAGKAGLQSPNSSAWAQSADPGSALETLQSPTSATWKSAVKGNLTPGSPTAAKSTAAAVAKSDVKVAEPQTATKDVSKTDTPTPNAKKAPIATTDHDDDDDSDEDEDDDDDEEEDDDDDSEDSEDDDEDSDEDDDEDDDDEDSDDSEDEKPVAKPVVKPAAKPATETTATKTAAS